MEEKNKFCMIVAIAILMLGSVQVLFTSPSMAVDPILVEVPITTGCSVEKCIPLCNPGEKATFQITYTVLPDSEGITITIPTSIVVERYSTTQLCFTIKTNALLMPLQYHILINVTRKTEEQPCDLTIQAWHSILINGKHSYFKVKVSGDHQLNGVYRGWCIDLDSTMVDGRKYTATDTVNTEGIPFIEHPENMDLIHWILNHHYIGQKSPAGGRYTFGDIQKAMWALLDDHQSSGYIGSYSASRVGRIVYEAKHYGEGFTPKNGQVIGVLLKPCDIKKAQICIIEVPFNLYHSYTST